MYAVNVIRVILAGSSIGAFFIARNWAYGNRQQAMIVRKRTAEIIRLEEEERRQALKKEKELEQPN